MKIAVRNDFWLVNVLSILLVLVTILRTGAIFRAVISWPYLLLIPGYVITAALFPRRNQLATWERITFSLGLSIAILPVTGLTLNLLPWGISLNGMVLASAIFTVAASALVWLRQNRLKPEDRNAVLLNWNIIGWVKEKPAARLLSIFLLAVMLGTTGIVTYYSIDSIGPRTDTFTEFYLLGINGLAGTSPPEVKVNQPASVAVGIVNREKTRITYRVVVKVNGVTSGESVPITLDHEAKWEADISFTPTRTGKNQRVEFYLYKESQTAPYLAPLRLTLTVNG
jgi:uncharacterized membrane protein